MWLVMALTGCVVSSVTDDQTLPDGTIELTWEVGSSGCDAAGVTDVVVTVGEVETGFPCANGTAKIEAPPGTIEIGASGLDAEGTERYAGTATATVISEETTAAHVVLSALPGAMRVTWYFENGRLCSANGVTDVKTTIFDDQDYVVDTVEAACEAGEVTFEDLEAGAYTAVVMAHDGSGVPMFEGDLDVVLDKGDRIEVEVQLFEP